MRAAARPGSLERLVRACLAATAVALPGGVVAAQYVGAGLLRLLVPAVVGVLCGAAGLAAAGHGAAGWGVRAAPAVYAVCGVALGFVLERSTAPGSAAALGPYAGAVVGTLLWTAPPRRVRVAAAG